jgi:hypothetical protein
MSVTGVLSIASIGSICELPELMFRTPSMQPLGQESAGQRQSSVIVISLPSVRPINSLEKCRMMKEQQGNDLTPPERGAALDSTFTRVQLLEFR